MPNKLRIIKYDGTSHIVPIKAIRGHFRLNSVLPLSKKSRLEEIDSDFNVVKVHEPGARAEAIAGQNEIARLKAENEALRNAAKNAETATIKEVMDKINAAEDEDQVNALIKGDKRPAVLKAAQQKLKILGA